MFDRNLDTSYALSHGAIIRKFVTMVSEFVLMCLLGSSEGFLHVGDLTCAEVIQLCDGTVPQSRPQSAQCRTIYP